MGFFEDQILLLRRLLQTIYYFSGLQEAVGQKVPVLVGQPGREGRHSALPHRALPVAGAFVRPTPAAVHQLDVGADG